MTKRPLLGSTATTAFVVVATVAACSPAPRADERSGPAVAARAKPVRMQKIVKLHGDGMVGGIVRDDEGAPIGGATVDLTFDVPTEEGVRLALPGSPPDEDGGPLPQREQGRSKTTGADGSYSFVDLPRIGMWIEAWAPGHARHGDFDMFRPDARIDLTLWKSWNKLIRIVRPDGSPVASAHVETMRGDRTARRDWSAAAPRVELTRAVARIRAVVDGSEPLVADWSDLSGDDLVSDAPIELRLRRRRDIRGHVRFSADVVPPAEVQIVADAGPGTLVATRRTTGTTGVDRSFTLEDVPAGEITLSARVWWHVASGMSWFRPGEILVERVVATADGEAEADLDVPPPDVAGAFVVRFVDSEGRAVCPDSVSYEAASPTFTYLGNARCGLRADRSLLVEPPRLGAGPVKHYLRISTAELGRRVVPLPDAPGSSMEVRLDPPARLIVTIADAPKTAQPTKFVIDATAADEPNPAWGDRDPNTLRTCDASSGATLGPLAPGMYEVAVTLDGNSYGVLARRRVELPSGTTQMTISLRDVYCTLTVEAGETRKFHFVHVRPADADHGESSARDLPVQTDAVGRAVFERLRRGIYDVELDDETRRVEVDGPVTLRW